MKKKKNKAKGFISEKPSHERKAVGRAERGNIWVPQYKSRLQSEKWVQAGERWGQHSRGTWFGCHLQGRMEEPQAAAAFVEAEAS